MPEVTISGEPASLYPLTTEQAFLVGDVVAGVLDVIAKFQDEAQTWRAAEEQRRSTTLDRQAAEDLNMAPAGHDWEAQPTITIPGVISTEEVLGRIVPKVWLRSRREATRALALVLLTPDELDAVIDSADYDAELEQLVQRNERRVRKAPMSDIVAAVQAAAAFHQQDLVDALGNFRSLLGEAREEASPRRANGSGPPTASATKRRAASAGRKRPR